MSEHFSEGEGQDGRSQRLLLIGPGEKLCLIGSSELSDMRLSPVPVPLNEQAEHLISVELQVFAFGTVLVLRNNFERAFDYHAFIKYPERAIAKTSVCSVRAHLIGLEQWPGPAQVVALADFTPLVPGVAPHCQ